MSKKVIITGGCGFVGHHFVEHLLKNTDWEIIIIDKLTYAANGLDRVKDINAFDNKRVSFYTADIATEISHGVKKEIGEVNYILHLAAESHVDRSIANPHPFIKSNIIGTYNMLELAKSMDNIEGFQYFGTDEVFGPAPNEVFYKEWDRYNCTNAYSATKAGAEELTLSYGTMYRLPVFITHTMNCMGERQHPEKFIPMCIKKILNGEEITIHSDSTRTISGSRHYIHCRNVVDGVLFLLDKFQQRDKYNIVGEKEVSNLELAKMISDIIGKELHYKFIDFHSSRPGHDLRYALDGSKMREIGWKPPKSFEKSLEKMVSWTLENKKWLEI